MARIRCLAVTLLLAVVAVSAAQASKSKAKPPEDEGGSEDYDEEGYRYGGKYVEGYDKQPHKAKYLQFAYATCPDPYDTFSFVTKIRVCKDKHGFITGLKYYSEHPIRHHDPTTVCDVVGHEGAAECETIKLYTEDWKWRRYRTVTNIRVAKVKDAGDRWRVVYIAFSYSDGNAVEFGTYPQRHGAKFEQWYQKPTPGMICGMNGFYSMGTVCDAKSGYLQWVKPCGKCIIKPKNYKCDADYCTKKIKKTYKGGYKGDFEDIDADDDDDEKYEEHESSYKNDDKKDYSKSDKGTKY